MIPAPPGLFELLTRDAGTNPFICKQCHEPLISGQAADGMCLQCAWGRPGATDTPWRWVRGEAHDISELGDYSSPTKPYSHQIKAQLLSRGAEAFGFLMEFGTGKSKTILDEWSWLVSQNESKDLIVVAPAGVYRGWQKEIETHLAPDLLEKTVVALWVSGGGAKIKRGLEAVLAEFKRPRILLVNAEALSTATKAADVISEIMSHKQTMLVVDESTLFRNVSASRTKTLLDLSNHARYRRIATGLPTPRSPLDLYGQFAFLDWRIIGQRTYFGFRARYAVLKAMNFGGRPRPTQVVVGYRNLDELRERIAPHVFRVQKDDCLDLPAKVYERRDVNMSAEQTRVYEELRRNATAQLTDTEHVTATNIMARRLRLLQVASGFIKDEEGKEHQLPNARMRALLDLLDETPGKAIIYAPWIILLEDLWATLRKEFGAEAIVRFWGAVRPEEREEAVARFQGDPGTRYIVANPSALGRGRTLTEASLIVYYANGDDLEVRLNSEDRPHRIGLKHSLSIVDLVSPGTVQESQLAAFRAKMDLAATVMGEDPKRWLI